MNREQLLEYVRALEHRLAQQTSGSGGTNPLAIHPDNIAIPALLEAMKSFVMIADEQGRPVVFNRAYATIIKAGLGVEPQVGVRPHDLLADGETRAYWDGLHKRVLGGERFTENYTHHFDNGTKHFVFRFTPIFDGPRVVGFIELSRDVTERKEAEMALEESERFLRECQEVAEMGTYVLDLSNGSWRSSEILDRVFGIGPDFDRTVEGWTSIVHPEWRETMTRYFEHEVVGARGRFDKEYKIVRPSDGAERWVHGLGRLALDGHGEPTEMLGTIRDITRRKEMELRVRHRQKMEAIGQLAGGVAHDFNNQLTGIMGFADLIRRDVGGDTPLGKYADFILSTAQHAAGLTWQLLAFSRKGMYVTEPVDVHRLIGEVLGALAHSTQESIVALQDLRAEAPIVMGDSSQLQSVILNLSLNARDAMKEGGDLTIATQNITLTKDSLLSGHDAKPGDYLRITVTDTGAGMTEEVRQHIFEPFYTTKEPGKGTGMGLAAVYGAIKSHGGSISVTSAPGQGSVFDLLFPGPQESPLDAWKAELASPKVSPRRILFVDDDLGVQSAVTRMLEEMGHTVTTCANGAEGVAVYERDHADFDLVILDMVMPVMGGREAFLEMKRINPTVSALLASGYSLAGEAQDILDQGVKGFIQKPFTIASLDQAIRDVLNSDSGPEL